MNSQEVVGGGHLLADGGPPESNKQPPSTMTQGYRLPFRRRPRVVRSPIFTTVANQLQAQTLQMEPSTLLEKGKIGEVERSDRQAGFFSRYFLIPKKDGGLCPILDHRGLNKYLRPLRCRFLTVLRVRQTIKAGDWFATIDLKDAYFHIPIGKTILPWMGCTGTPLAADPALRLPPINPPSSPSVQGTNGAGEANPGCTVLASHVLVLYPTRGSAMDASSQRGPPVSGRREIVPLLPSRA